MADPRIRTTIIIFTPDSVSVGTIGDDINQSGSYLKIQVTPVRNGKNIHSIKVWYNNPSTSSGPSRLNEEIVDENVFESLVHGIDGFNETLVDKAVHYMRTLPSDEV